MNKLISFTTESWKQQNKLLIFKKIAEKWG